MKKLLTLLILPLMFVSFFPVSASAETNAGIGPNSFFYFFDTTFEKINLFFTFNSEKKAQKAVSYVEERIAEIEELDFEKKPNVASKAIKQYKKDISLVADKALSVNDNEKREKLLTIISENTKKHQEILVEVYNKVPDDAKEAIKTAIEASVTIHEQSLRQIVELQGEVVELKQKIAELEEEIQDSESGDTEELKKEIKVLKEQQISQPVKPKVIEKIVEKIVDISPSTTQEDSQPISEIEIEEDKTETIAILPNGAIVELDEEGNFIRFLKEAPVDTSDTPSQLQNQQQTQDIHQQNNTQTETQTPTTTATSPLPPTPVPSPPSEPEQDTISPVISNIQATNITDSSVTITWTTDELSDGKVNYDMNSPIPTITFQEIGADNVINHSINISNLSHSQTYYFVIKSRDESGNTTTSSEKSFTTLLPPTPEIEIVQTRMVENGSDYTVYNNSNRWAKYRSVTVKTWTSNIVNEFDNVSLEFYGPVIATTTVPFSVIADSEINAIEVIIPVRNTSCEALDVQPSDGCNFFLIRPTERVSVQPIDVRLEVHAVGTGNPNDRFFIKLVSFNDEEFGTNQVQRSWGTEYNFD
jgi:hypothetical protein